MTDQSYALTTLEDDIRKSGTRALNRMACADSSKECQDHLLICIAEIMELVNLHANRCAPVE